MSRYVFLTVKLQFQFATAYNNNTYYRKMAPVTFHLPNGCSITKRKCQRLRRQQSHSRNFSSVKKIKNEEGNLKRR